MPDEIKIIERKVGNFTRKYTILKNDRVHIITTDKSIADRYRKEIKNDAERK